MRMALVAHGVSGWVLHPRGVKGRPDFYFARKKLVVFVDGCFWHKCPECYIEPKSNEEYWLPKIEKNVERDKKNNVLLNKEGWKVIRVWEHELNKDFGATFERIEEQLKCR